MSETDVFIERTVLMRQPNRYHLHDLIGHGWPVTHTWLSVNGSCAGGKPQQASSLSSARSSDVPVCGMCNASHFARYVVGTAEQQASIRPAFVVFDEDYVLGKPAKNKERAAASSNESRLLLFLREPPAHLPWREVSAARGFVGYWSFQHAADLWAPHMIARTVASSWWHHMPRTWTWRADAAKAQTEAAVARASIGIYHDNCRSTLRNPVIEELMSSGLAVRSYGKCHNNMPRAILDSDEGRALCVHHRLMLAVENHACADWISPNLDQALSCGAVPIVATRADVQNGGVSVRDHVALCPLALFTFARCPLPFCPLALLPYLALLSDIHRAHMPPRVPPRRASRPRHPWPQVPDYDALVGPLPRVDASLPGWLDEVRRLMANDTHYLAYRKRMDAWADPSPGRGLWHSAARADAAHSHCVWFDDSRLVAPRTLRWPNCTESVPEPIA